MLEAIRHAMENLKQAYNKTMDLPSKMAASGDVDPALAPIEKELQQALASLHKLAQNKGKQVHASELRPARETLGACVPCVP
jgi:hypothetical protein